MKFEKRAGELPSIPVLRTGADFPFETLIACEQAAHALIDGATRHASKTALRALDAISRAWLAKWNHAHLAEIDRVAERMKRPGAYFLSVNYEWGCTVGVHPTADNTAAALARVLDWQTPGLGRHVIAAIVSGRSGTFVTLTWPGYTGILQAMAPGRFSAAINQAPMPHRGGGIYPFDWLANKLRVWQTPHATPAHVLRVVFENALTFGAARDQLISTPIATPVIFSLAGTEPNELCIIERTEDDAYVHDGANAAANAWQAPGWNGRERGEDNIGRVAQMSDACWRLRREHATDFSWLSPPVLNDHTRLALLCDARRGRVLAQGFEANGPATAMLDLNLGTGS
ncbi:MAG: hypothetical protein ACR2PG_20220 [Hyphomicrobiaceae bacterium]